MAQTGYTPIVLYNSTTANAVPTTSNLQVGELALNVTDGKLYFNQSGTITVIASTTATAGNANNLNGGAAGELPYQSATGSTAFTSVGTAGQVLISGGTGAPTWSSNAVVGQLQTANFTIQQLGTKLYFQYNGANVASLDNSGNFISLAVKAGATP